MASANFEPNPGAVTDSGGAPSPQLQVLAKAQRGVFVDRTRQAVFQPAGTGGWTTIDSHPDKYAPERSTSKEDAHAKFSLAFLKCGRRWKAVSEADQDEALSTLKLCTGACTVVALVCILVISAVWRATSAGESELHLVEVLNGNSWAQQDNSGRLLADNTGSHRLQGESAHELGPLQSQNDGNSWRNVADKRLSRPYQGRDGDAEELQSSHAQGSHSFQGERTYEFVPLQNPNHGNSWKNVAEKPLSRPHQVPDGDANELQSLHAQGHGIPKDSLHQDQELGLASSHANRLASVRHINALSSQQRRGQSHKSHAGRGTAKVHAHLVRAAPAESTTRQRRPHLR